MRCFRLLTVVGARPKFVKTAAISRAVAVRDDIEEILVHTGGSIWRRDVAMFFDEFGIGPPLLDLDINRGNPGTILVAHSSGLWTFDRRRARHQADLARQRPGLACGIGRAIVRQPLDRQRQSPRT
jgi:hypothetical protein